MRVKLFILSALLLLSGCEAGTGLRTTNELTTNENDIILNAIRNNNIKKLGQLLKGKVNYFSRDDEKILYSKIGQDFLFRDIDLDTIKFMYNHGLNLNDLKEIRVSYSVERLLKSNNIQNTDIDFKFDKNKNEKEDKIIESEKDIINGLKFYNDEIKKLFSSIYSI